MGVGSTMGVTSYRSMGGGVAHVPSAVRSPCMGSLKQVVRAEVRARARRESCLRPGLERDVDLTRGRGSGEA